MPGQRITIAFVFGFLFICLSSTRSFCLSVFRILLFVSQMAVRNTPVHFGMSLHLFSCSSWWLRMAVLDALTRQSCDRFKWFEVEGVVKFLLRFYFTCLQISHLFGFVVAFIMIFSGMCRTWKLQLWERLEGLQHFVSNNEIDLAWLS